MRRRQFLAAAPAAALAACGGEVDTSGPAGDRADLDLLRAGLELEYTAIALYTAGLEIARRPLIQEVLEHERAHAAGLREAIVDLRAKPAEQRALDGYTASFPRLRDERAFMRFAAGFERRVAESYAAAIPRLRTQRLRGTLCSLLAAEAAHAAALAEAAGDNPLDRVLALPA